MSNEKESLYVMKDVLNEVLTNPLYENLFDVKTKSFGGKVNLSDEYYNLALQSINFFLNHQKENWDKQKDDDELKQEIKQFLSDLELDCEYNLIATFPYLSLMKFLLYIDSLNPVFELKCTQEDCFTYFSHKYVILVKCSRQKFDKDSFAQFALDFYKCKREGKFKTQSQIILYNPMTDSMMKKSVKMIEKTLAPLFSDCE